MSEEINNLPAQEAPVVPPVEQSQATVILEDKPSPVAAEAINLPEVLPPVEKPVTSQPESITPPPDNWTCPACGKVCDARRDLLNHYRLKHTELDYKTFAKGVPQPGEKQRPGGERLPTSQDNIPAPDFSDITGEPPKPRFDTNGSGSAPPPIAPLIAPAHYEATAALTFDMTTGALSKLFGNEWQPQSKEERLMMVQAIKTYYESIEMPDIPPGAMLCILCLAYSAPRLAQPSTQGKLITAWLWVKSKVFRRKRATLTIAKEEKKL